MQLYLRLRLVFVSLWARVCLAFARQQYFSPPQAAEYGPARTARVPRVKRETTATEEDRDVVAPEMNDDVMDPAAFDIGIYEEEQQNS
ncbi:hypothetical protein DOE73_29680 [Paenibacillus dendritiformis]|nr:hypothetical protein DOE73_29680 [Paenibacillus dendritiformis]